MLQFHTVLLFLGFLVIPNLAAQSPNLLIVGDSLSAAYGVSEEKGWVSLLTRRLQQEGYAHTVVNASISGDTSQNAHHRLGPLLKNYHPTIVILELGANDGLRGLSLTSLIKHLSEMIQEIQATHSKILLLGMRIPPNYGPDYTQVFAALYADLAQTASINLVPFMLEGIATNPTLMLNDGLHPNEAGQALILEVVWPVLKPLLAPAH